MYRRERLSPDNAIINNPTGDVRYKPMAPLKFTWVGFWGLYVVCSWITSVPGYVLGQAIGGWAVGVLFVLLLPFLPLVLIRAWVMKRRQRANDRAYPHNVEFAAFMLTLPDRDFIEWQEFWHGIQPEMAQEQMHLHEYFTQVADAQHRHGRHPPIIHP